MRKQDVLAFIESAPAEEPPLHIESPYRPEPVARPAAPVSTAAGCRGCAGRSAST